MIGLDTNILVRYLTQDDPEQSAQANRLIETRCTPQDPGYLPLLVLCELVWVLAGAYAYQKSLIIQVLEHLLASPELEVESHQFAASALRAYKTGTADFSDYVILFTNKGAGCERLYSFDRKLLKHAFVCAP